MSGRQRLPNRRTSETFDIEVAGLRYKVTIGRFADGGRAEVFISNHKAGNASASGVVGAVLDKIIAGAAS